MKKLICFIFLLLILGCSLEIREFKQVCIKDQCFNVELSKTESQREMGLMNKDYLESNEGMLFIFNKEDNYPFWMKNTLIPLDIIWINENKEIVFINKNTQPCIKENCDVIDPNVNASYVLEINANKSNNFNLGDKFDIK